MGQYLPPKHKHLPIEIYVMTIQKIIVYKISCVACENNNTDGILSHSQTDILPWRLLTRAKRNHTVHRMSSHATEVNHSQFSWLIECLILCRNAHTFLRPKQDNTWNFPHTVLYDSQTRRWLSCFPKHIVTDIRHRAWFKRISTLQRNHSHKLPLPLLCGTNNNSVPISNLSASNSHSFSFWTQFSWFPLGRCVRISRTNSNSLLRINQKVIIPYLYTCLLMTVIY